MLMINHLLVNTVLVYQPDCVSGLYESKSLEEYGGGPGIRPCDPSIRPRWIVVRISFKNIDCPNFNSVETCMHQSIDIQSSVFFYITCQCSAAGKSIIIPILYGAEAIILETLWVRKGFSCASDKVYIESERFVKTGLMICKQNFFFHMLYEL